MNETISALRLDLNDFDERVSYVVERHKPNFALRRAWIPQTICDQIWVLYDFPSVALRESWEDQLPLALKKCLDRGLIEHALSYGWHSRNIDGFIQA